MKKLLIIAVFVLIANLSCSSGSSGNSNFFFPQDNGKIVAEFDGIKITDKYLKSYIDELNPYLKSRYNTPEKKEELIVKIIEGEIVARKALKEGALNDSSLLFKLKSMIARYYNGTKMKIEIENALKVTEDEMKKYYETNKESFNQPEKVKASHILVKINDKRDKDEAKKLAAKIAAEAKKDVKNPKSFSELVKKYSEDEGSKKRGGDVGYFERSEEGGKMVKPFSDAAFALAKIGDISDPVESEFGFHVIKLTGKKDKVVKSFDDVKISVENTLKAEKRNVAFQNSIDSIKKELGYKFYKEAAMEIDLNVSPEIQKSSNNLDKKNTLKKPILTKEQAEQIIKRSQTQQKSDSESKIELKLNKKLPKAQKSDSEPQNDSKLKKQ